MTTEYLSKTQVDEFYSKIMNIEIDGKIHDRLMSSLNGVINVCYDYTKIDVDFNPEVIWISTQFL